MYVVVQLLSHVQLFCNPMDCSTPGFPVLQHLLELAQNSGPLNQSTKVYSMFASTGKCLLTFIPPLTETKAPRAHHET